ncbi:MAG: M20 family metallopeptidase [Candidatus Altiarchaeota archaeon]|nr:M20 family metallopeptidase [Candidatus Altiarchaeota archaeon]
MDKDRLIRTTQELVRIPSVTGNEKALGEYIISDLESNGIKTKTDEVGNVYAEFGEGKKSLMLNAHLDTVPPEGYVNNPYSGTIEGDRIFGLGASDCKAGLASMMEIVKSIPNIDGKLILAFTVCEESVLKGTRLTKGSMYAAEQYKTDACIVLEPTMYDGSPKISAGCRGRMILELKVIGKSTHSSRPHTGKNAIDESVKLINHLKEHDLMTGHYFGDPLPETLSIVRIKSGASATNIIPSLSEVTVDYRTLPGRTDVVNKIKKSIEHSGVDTEVEIPYFSPGYYLDSGLPIVKLAESCVYDTFKKEPKLMVALGRADSEYFYRNGIPAIIYGPGENYQAHKPDEYTTISGLVNCTESIIKITKKFLSA